MRDVSTNCCDKRDTGVPGLIDKSANYFETLLIGPSHFRILTARIVNNPLLRVFTLGAGKRTLFLQGNRRHAFSRFGIRSIQDAYFPDSVGRRES